MSQIRSIIQLIDPIEVVTMHKEAIRVQSIQQIAGEYYIYAIRQGAGSYRHPDKGFHRRITTTRAHKLLKDGFGSCRVK